MLVPLSSRFPYVYWFDLCKICSPMWCDCYLDRGYMPWLFHKQPNPYLVIVKDAGHEGRKLQSESVLLFLAIDASAQSMENYYKCMLTLVCYSFRLTTLQLIEGAHADRKKKKENSFPQPVLPVFKGRPGSRGLHGSGGSGALSSLIVALNHSLNFARASRQWHGLLLRAGADASCWSSSASDGRCRKKMFLDVASRAASVVGDSGISSPSLNRWWRRLSLLLPPL
jgi:hypothetical protein